MVTAGAAADTGATVAGLEVDAAAVAKAGAWSGWEGRWEGQHPRNIPAQK